MRIVNLVGEIFKDVVCRFGWLGCIVIFGGDLGIGKWFLLENKKCDWFEEKYFVV